MKKSTHRLAVLLSFLTFGLLLLGGEVHNTASSLACPDWPLCYGSFLPTMKGNIAIEHSHRLFAALVGLLTVILSLLIYRDSKRGAYADQKLVRLGFVSVFLVIVQGVLGGLTVIYGLPDAISTAHLGVSFLFFATVLLLAERTKRTYASESPGSGSYWTVIAAIAVYLQCLLGAFVRHTGSGIVCTDFPLCYGSVWPTGVHASVLLHMSHRWMAVVAGLFVMRACWLAVFGKVASQRSMVLGLIVFVLFFTQILLGAASVLTHLGQVPVTAHLGVAALLWGSLVLLRFGRCAI